MRYLLPVVVIVAAGCLSTTYIPTVHYTVDPEPRVDKTEPVDFTLAVRPLDPAQPYRQRIAYRDSGHILGYIPHAEWAELPRDVVTCALTDALLATERFQDVGEATDLRNPDLILTGRLRRFDQIRTADPWYALCEVRLEVRGGLDRYLVWGRTLSVCEKLEGTDPSSLADAMSRAVGRIAEDAASQLSALDVIILNGTDTDEL